MKERDEEIDVIIARFEEESAASQKDTNRKHEEKMNALKDKQSSQLAEVCLLPLCLVLEI
jgi:hypothetical protein